MFRRTCLFNIFNALYVKSLTLFQNIRQKEINLTNNYKTATYNKNISNHYLGLYYRDLIFKDSSTRDLSS